MTSFVDGPFPYEQYFADIVMKTNFSLPVVLKKRHKHKHVKLIFILHWGPCGPSEPNQIGVQSGPNRTDQDQTELAKEQTEPSQTEPNKMFNFVLNESNQRVIY